MNRPAPIHAASGAASRRSHTNNSGTSSAMHSSDGSRAAARLTPNSLKLCATIQVNSSPRL